MTFHTASGVEVGPIGFDTSRLGITPPSLPSHVRPMLDPAHYFDAYDIVAQAANSAEAVHLNLGSLPGNEWLIGHVVSILQAEQTIPGRNALHIATTLQEVNIRPRNVMPSLQNALGAMGLAQFDLVYVCTNKPSALWRAGLKTVAEAQNSGLTRSIGLTGNLNPSTLEKAADAIGEVLGPEVTVPIAAVRLDCSLATRSRRSSSEVPALTPKLRQWCTDNKVQVVATQPLGGGTLTDLRARAVAVAHNLSPAHAALAYLIKEGIAPVMEASFGNVQLAQEAVDLAARLTPQDMAILNSQPPRGRRNATSI